MKLTNFAFIVSQIIIYLLAVIVIVQIIKSILGGTWEVENVILALLCLNITISFSTIIYLFNGFSGVNRRIDKLENKLEVHLGWHKGIDSK